MNASNDDTGKPTTNDICELTDAELEAIAGGGQAGLTPAQRSEKQKAETTPTETLSLNFSKSVFSY